MRMPNYPEPVTPASTHPTGCVGCKVEDGPHKWTPSTAARQEAVARLRDPDRNEWGWSCVTGASCQPDGHTYAWPCLLTGLLDG